MSLLYLTTYSEAPGTGMVAFAVEPLPNASHPNGGALSRHSDCRSSTAYKDQNRSYPPTCNVRPITRGGSGPFQGM
jgi:hypothetical protein